MEGGFILETNNPYIPKPEFDFTVNPEDYTFVTDARYDSEFVIDNREAGFEHAFGTVSFEQATLAIEKLREAMKTIDGALFNDIKNSLLDLKLTYDEYKRYMYTTASNNQLKRHGLPMRRKVKR